MQHADVQDGAAIQGDHSTAVGSKGVFVDGDVNGDVVTGEKRTINIGDIKSSPGSEVNIAGGDIIKNDKKPSTTKRDRVNSDGPKQSNDNADHTHDQEKKEHT